MNRKQMEARLAALRADHEKDHVELSADTFDLSIAKDRLIAFDAREAEIKTLEDGIRAAISIEERIKKATLSGAKPGATARPNILDKPFNSFGEQLRAVVDAARPGASVDPRLAELTASGAGENTPSDGGFLVVPEYSELVLRQVFDVAQLAGRCSTTPLASNANALVVPYVDETSRVDGSRWGGVQIYRSNEGDTVTAKKPKIGRWEVRLEKLMGLMYASDELLQDATALGAIATQAFAEEFAYVIDNEILRGNGAGQCLGILNAAALISVAKESGQAAATVDALNIIKMRARMPARFRKNAAWFINQDVEAALPTMKLATGSSSGQLVYMPAGGLTGNPYDTLYGMPVIPIEQCSTLGTVGDIVLADLSQYALVTKGGLKADASMHVRFIYDEMTFRWTYRINGQSKFKSAITPAQGTNTLSPFVALATRA